MTGRAWTGRYRRHDDGGEENDDNAVHAWGRRGTPARIGKRSNAMTMHDENTARRYITTVRAKSLGPGWWRLLLIGAFHFRMGRGKALTDQEHWWTIGLHDGGVSLHEISRKTGRSRTSVRKTIKTGRGP
ncbi:hypothetical protein PC123_g27789 [Phytophthora cactorum]|nr:hypothetical protein PC123_g27789 [Phytophthora cactorum]